VKVNAASQATNVSGIFAGGDAVTGPATVIEAIAAGRKAAAAIDRFLKGQKVEEEEIAPRTIGIEDVEVARFKKRTRQEMAEAPASERAKGFSEVELGFDELTALFEADRCFQCGLFPNKEKNAG
jgi:NADPH-dependent glutamate synthase beta subunit-like oxidoreductase